MLAHGFNTAGGPVCCFARLLAAAAAAGGVHPPGSAGEAADARPGGSGSDPARGGGPFAVTGASGIRSSGRPLPRVTASSR